MGVQELAVVGLVGSGVGAALGLPMVWSRPGRAADPRVLGGALLLMSAIAALISGRLAGLVPPSAGIEHAINLIGLTAFPLAVIYTRQATGAPDQPRWLPALWTPAGAYLAVLVVRGGLGLDTRVPFAWLLPVVLAFTAMSAAVVWRGQTTQPPALVPPQWVVGFLVLVNVAQIVRMDFGHVPVMRALVPLVFASGFVALVAFVAWRIVAPRAVADPALPAKYERSGLVEPAAVDLLARVDTALTGDRLFARTDLTLAHLAAAADSTPHQVSEALNRFRGVTFHELVNRRRVEDVKAQLGDPLSDRYTIEGIGASAGFGSRSALYAAFHRFEGMTPTAYRTALRSGVHPPPSAR
jgi:AraC-like DNA-binding protein